MTDKEKLEEIAELCEQVHCTVIEVNAINQYELLYLMGKIGGIVSK